MTAADAAEAWADFLDADELLGVVHAVGVFERMGQLTPDEARAWRRSILERHGLPLRAQAQA